MSSFDEKAVLNLDSWLEPFLPAIAHRRQSFIKWKTAIRDHEGGYDSFTKGFLNFGLNVKEDASVVYREWAPNATEAVLIGDFSSSCLEVDYGSRWFISQTRRPMEQDLSHHEEGSVRCLGDHYSSQIPGYMRYSSRLQAEGLYSPHVVCICRCDRAVRSP
jgi:hypothetical protein